MTTTEHYTAWITTDTSCLDQDNADITVLRDEQLGADGDPNGWSSTGDPVHYATTSINARTGDHDDIVAEAKALLAAAEWDVTGTWEAVPTGYTATVERD